MSAVVTHALQHGRAAFLRRMRGTCQIDRPTGTTDDGKGGVTETLIAVATAPCYIRYPGLAHESTFDVAGASVSQSRVVVRVPFGTVYRPGDRVTVLSDPDNPQLVGTVLRVASIDDMSQATAQRLLCEDNQSGVAS